MITNYAVVTANSIDELESKVKDAMRNDWELGQFSVTAGNDPELGHYLAYFQTMTKTRPDRRYDTGPG